MRTYLQGRGILAAVVERRDVESLDERRLLTRARRGDRDAFDQLVERHLQQVWRVVWRVVRHRQDTEDVVQDVFLAAYSSLGEFRGESKLSTWLHRIAVTRALNHVDRSAVKMERSARSLFADEGGVPRADGPPPLHASDPPTPLEQLEASELKARLARCLERLPSAWRAILALRDGESMPYQRIAETLGVALGTVRSRLARARLALRECLEGSTP